MATYPDVVLCNWSSSAVHHKQQNSTDGLSNRMINVLLLIYVVIFVAGVVGNVLVVVVIIKNRSMRTVANFFLVSLSSADLLIILFCMPVAVYELYNSDLWIFGNAICKLTLYFQYLTVNASILTILSISVERFLVICMPLKAKSYCTRKRTAFTIAGVWIFCALSSSPALSHNEVRLNEETCAAECNLTEGHEWFSIAQVAIFYILPGILLSFIYALIIRALRESPNMESTPKNDSKVVLTGRRWGQSLARKFSTCSKYCSTNSGQRVKLTCRKSGRTNEKRSQLIVMLAAVIAAYFCCLLPFNAVVLWAILWPSTFEAFDSDKRVILIIISRLLFYSNSCCNPLLYSAISSRFRNAFLSLFCPSRNNGSVMAVSVCHRPSLPSLANRVSLVSANDSLLINQQNPDRGKKPDVVSAEAAGKNYDLEMRTQSDWGYCSRNNEDFCTSTKRTVSRQRSNSCNTVTFFSEKTALLAKSAVHRQCSD